MKKYCDYCGKLIGEPDKIYMAGTICEGHTLSIWKYLIYRISKFINKTN